MLVKLYTISNFFYILEVKKYWTILLPQTKFAGPAINGAPVSATIALPLSNENEWIVAVKNKQLKMVKLRVTGANTFDYITTKWAETSQYDASCLTSFTESCFVGNVAKKHGYEIKLVAEGTTIKLSTDIIGIILFQRDINNQ